MNDPAPWLYSIAWISILAAILSALWIALDILRGHRQKMWIMDVVWPVTGLWAGPLGLWAYYRMGRASGKERKEKPFWQSVAVGATHCGAGCSLGDLMAEGGLAAFPLVLFGSKVFGTWLVDFILAFLFGIAFQYFTIKPMKQLSSGEGLIAALKADSLSLIAWQLGMYGWMAVALFGLFGPGNLPKTSPMFWFMMQIAMLAGFATSYPMNWWLLRKGIKEAM